MLCSCGSTMTSTTFRLSSTAWSQCQPVGTITDHDYCLSLNLVASGYKPTLVVMTLSHCKLFLFQLFVWSYLSPNTISDITSPTLCDNLSLALRIKPQEKAFSIYLHETSITRCVAEIAAVKTTFIRFVELQTRHRNWWKKKPATQLRTTSIASSILMSRTVAAVTKQEH